MPAAEVLDSHALLTLLRDEPGAETVARILERAGQRDQPVHMTEVNDAEVQYMIRRKDGDDAWTVVAAGLNALPIHFHPADRRLADAAADFKARFKLSLADAFAAALAREKQGRLITGDPEFKPLEKEISINLAPVTHPGLALTILEPRMHGDPSGSCSCTPGPVRLFTDDRSATNSTGYLMSRSSRAAMLK